MSEELMEEYLRLVGEENEHVYELERLLEEIAGLDNELACAIDSMEEWIDLEDGFLDDSVSQRRSRINELRQSLIEKGTHPVHTPALINPELLEEARQNR